MNYRKNRRKQLVSNVDELMNALYKGDFDAIDNALKQGANVNEPYNKNGWTPFMWACKEFYEMEVIAYFLVHKGDVKSRNSDGETPFMIAERKRSSPETLMLLLDNGSDINAQDNWGDTVLMVAASHPQASMRLGILDFLIKHGADTEICNNKGKSVWDYVETKSEVKDFLVSCCKKYIAKEFGEDYDAEYSRA